MGIGQLAALHFTGTVGKEAQPALRTDLRVELAQRTGRRVARIGQHLAAVQARTLVVGLEVGAGHVHLAAHLQHIRPVLAVQALGNVADLAQIGRHVLAGRAIATGRAEHEMTVLVAQADRQPVHLRLGRKPQAATPQPLVNAAHEISHLLVAERIGQRQHRHSMAHLGEAAGRTRTDLLGRAVGAGQFRMFALQCFQFAHQPVVIDVGDLRRVQLMVGAVGSGDLPAEVVGAFGGAGTHRDPVVLGWPGILPRPAVRPCNALPSQRRAMLDGRPLPWWPTFSPPGRCRPSPPGRCQPWLAHLQPSMARHYKSGLAAHRDQR